MRDVRGRFVRGGGVQIQGGIRPGGEAVADTLDAIQQEMTRFGVAAVKVFQERWIGFRHPSGRSRAAWRSTPARVEGSGISVEITNEARDPDGGKPYAAYVHTPGNPEPLAAYLQATAIDPMARDLTRRLAGLPALSPVED